MRENYFQSFVLDGVTLFNNKISGMPSTLNLCYVYTRDWSDAMDTNFGQSMSKSCILFLLKVYLTSPNYEISFLRNAHLSNIFESLCTNTIYGP